MKKHLSSGRNPPLYKMSIEALVWKTHWRHFMTQDKIQMSNYTQAQYLLFLIMYLLLSDPEAP